jgi:hypothetical protein
MLKKSSSFALASLRGSTYGLCKRLFPQAMGGPGENSVRFARKTLVAHRLAPVRRRDAHYYYFSRRGPRYGLAGRPF